MRFAHDGQIGIGLGNVEAQGGVALVVLQNPIVARSVALDQIGFQDQGFFFGVRQNGFIRSDLGNQQRGFRVMRTIGLKVGLEPLFQIARFAHIDDGTLIVLHEVDPGQMRHISQLFIQSLAAVLFIGRFDFHKLDKNMTRRVYD